MIKDKCILYRNPDLSYSKCYACNLKSHSIEFCPVLHFLPDRLFIIQRLNYSEPIIYRTQQKRREMHSLNARSHHFIISKELKEFLLTLETNSIESFDDSNDKDSQKSLSISLTEEDSRPNLHKDSTQEIERARKHSDFNLFRRESIDPTNFNNVMKVSGVKIDDKIGTRKDEIMNETIYQDQASGAYGIRKEDGVSRTRIEESLQLYGDEGMSASEKSLHTSVYESRRRNSHLNAHNHQCINYKKKSKNEETWKGVDWQYKKTKYRELMNGEEGAEIGKHWNWLDSKALSSKGTMMVKDDIIFRY